MAWAIYYYIDSSFRISAFDTDSDSSSDSGTDSSSDSDYRSSATEPDNMFEEDLGSDDVSEQNPTRAQ